MEGLPFRKSNRASSVSMSVGISSKVTLLLAALEVDLPAIRDLATPAEFWIVFSARAARIKSLSVTDDERKVVSKRLDELLQKVGLSKRRLH